MARLKRLRISGALLVNMCAEGTHIGYSVVADAVPSGTRILNVWLGEHETLEILLAHDSFENLSAGQEIPFITPVMRGEHFMPMPADA